MKIISNGSKFLGEPLDTMDDLLECLRICTLDPTFESYGNFVYPHEGKAGTIRCFGNFADVSHVFTIDGTKVELQPLIDAIRANQKSERYLALRAKLKMNAWRIVLAVPRKGTLAIPAEQNYPTRERAEEVARIAYGPYDIEYRIEKASA